MIGSDCSEALTVCLGGGGRREMWSGLSGHKIGSWLLQGDGDEGEC